MYFSRRFVVGAGLIVIGLYTVHCTVGEKVKETNCRVKVMVPENSTKDQVRYIDIDIPSPTACKGCTRMG